MRADEIMSGQRVKITRTSKVDGGETGSATYFATIDEVGELPRYGSVLAFPPGLRERVQRGWYVMLSNATKARSNGMLMLGSLDGHFRGPNYTNTVRVEPADKSS